MTQETFKRVLIIFSCVVGAACLTMAQVSSGGLIARPTAVFDFTNAGQTIPARKLTSDPTTCAVGEQYFNTTLNVLKVCTAIDTWSNYAPGAGGVSSVALSAANTVFTISGSPVTAAGTLTVTPAGTSGGIPYFSAANAMTSSGALGANNVMVGGGAGLAPKTTGVAIDGSNNISTPGILSTGTAASTHGKLALGELPSNGSTTVGWEAPDLITSSLSLLFPNSNPSANSVMLFPAPTSGQSQFAWTTFTSTNLTDSTNLVRNNQANTYSAGNQDFSSAASLAMPVAAGMTTTTNGRIGYDSTGNQLHAAINSADAIIPTRAPATPVNGNCAKWGPNGQLQDQGATCGSGGGAGGSTLRNWSIGGTALSGTAVDVYSYDVASIPDGKCIRARAFLTGTNGSSVTTSFKWDFGGTVLSYGSSLAWTTQNVSSDILICNDPASHNAQTLNSGALNSSASLVSGGIFTTAALDTSTSKTLKFQYTAGSTSTATNKGFIVETIQ